VACLTTYTKRGSYGFFDVKNMEDKIMGGAFMLSRQIFTSKIWQDKPSSWKIIWIYILGQVNHKDNDRFKRGEGFFNFSRELSTKNIGCDITSDMIKKFLQFARSSSMVSTKRSTRGTIIKVLNYNKYQTLSNYESTTSSTNKARKKHERSTTINKNDKNDKNDKNIIIAKPSLAIDKSVLVNKFSIKGVKKTKIELWQDEASNAIKALSCPEDKISSVFKCFKDNEPKAKIALSDCKELSKLNVLYFFKVFNELTK